MSYEVYLIKCTGCAGILSLRGRNIYVLSKEDLKGYATDLCTDLVMEAKIETKFQHCQCKIKKLTCKACNIECGYHLTKICPPCKKQHIGIDFVFLNAIGQLTPTKWSQLQKIQKQKIQKDFFQQLDQSGISDLTIQILKNEQIRNFKELSSLSDQLLKQVGIKLGEIVRLRNVQKQNI